MQLQSPQKNRKKFLNSINYFRGLAIVLIVLSHCYHLANWEISSIYEQVFYSLTLNGSVFFVFISGFLYHHVFYHKFDYPKFLTKKAKFVLLPYICFSTIPILYAVFFDGGGEFLPEYLRDKHLLAILWYYLTGRISYAYWYIPMAVLLFVLSPLINRIVESKKVLVAFLFLLPISLLVHRPIDNINPFQSLVYYLPVYLIGIWSSIEHSAIRNYLRNKIDKISLLIIAIILGLTQVMLFEEVGNFHKAFWSITVPDVNLLQKITLCFLFMSILDCYENTDLGIVKKTAETSFAIYFIHPFLINFFMAVFSKLDFDYQGNIIILILATITVTMISMAIALSLKAIFKKNSRYLIGW